MRYSGSKTGLWMLCRHWAQPHIEWSKDETVFSERGHAFHHYRDVVHVDRVQEPIRPWVARNYPKLGFYQEDLDTLEHWDGIWRESVEWPKAANCEVAFAYNPLTGAARTLGTRINRKYKEFGLLDDEIGMSCDAIWMVPEADLVVVGDIKTGAQRNLTPVEDNWQIRTLCVAAARVTGMSRARGVIWHVNDEVRTTYREWDAFDLAAFEWELSEAERAFRRGEHEPKPGPHCRDQYCPALAACPAAHSTVRALVPPEAIVPSRRLLGPIQGPDEASYRLSVLPLLKRAVETMEEGLRRYADDYDGILTPDGVWKRKSVPVEKIDCSSEAVEVLDKYLGDSGLEVAVTMSASKTSVERAVKHIGLKPIKHHAETIMSELRRSGCLTFDAKTTYEVEKT